MCGRPMQEFFFLVYSACMNFFHLILPCVNFIFVLRPPPPPHPRPHYLSNGPSLKGNNNVIESRKQDFHGLNANRKNLVSYEDLREIFVSKKEFVFPMGPYFDHAGKITCKQ